MKKSTKKAPKRAYENLRWVVAATLAGVGYVLWKNRSNAHETIGAHPPRDPNITREATRALLRQRVATMEATRDARPRTPEQQLALWTHFHRHHRTPLLPTPPHRRS